MTLANSPGRQLRYSSKPPVFSIAFDLLLPMARFSLLFLLLSSLAFAQPQERDYYTLATIQIGRAHV
jgi:hypothetical protein